MREIIHILLFFVLMLATIAYLLSGPDSWLVVAGFLALDWLWVQTIPTTR